MLSIAGVALSTRLPAAKNTGLGDARWAERLCRRTSIQPPAGLDCFAPRNNPPPRQRACQVQLVTVLCTTGAGKKLSVNAASAEFRRPVIALVAFLYSFVPQSRLD